MNFTGKKFAGLVVMVAGIAMDLAIATVHAGPITWESPVQTVAAETGGTSTAVVFRFRNDGDAPVTFGPITPSCGCTVGELARQTWQPGETGELIAHVRVGEDDARKTVTLHITYVDTVADADALEFTVTTRAWCEVTPRLLWWKQGEVAPAKDITVAFGAGFATSTVEIVGDMPAGFRLETMRRTDTAVTIAVAPTTASAPQSRQLHLRLVRPDGLAVQRTIFLRVM